MVLLIRPVGRLAASSWRPASRPLCTAAARRPRVASARAAAAAAAMPLQNGFGSIRTLTGIREKVKVLLVLYDGKQHAKDVSDLLSGAPSMHTQCCDAQYRTCAYDRRSQNSWARPRTSSASASGSKTRDTP